MRKILNGFYSSSDSITIRYFLKFRNLKKYNFDALSIGIILLKIGKPDRTDSLIAIKHVLPDRTLIVEFVIKPQAINLLLLLLGHII